MARRRISLSYITRDAQRKASFKKRARGLIKKVSEISTLCGVQACAVIYSDFDSKPMVWPSPDGAKEVLQRFMGVPEIERAKRTENLESITRQRIEKTKELLYRLRRENKLKQLEIFMYMVIQGKANIKDLDPSDAPAMREVVDKTLRAVTQRMELLEKAGAVHDDGDGDVINSPAMVAAPVAESGGVDGEESGSCSKAE